MSNVNFYKKYGKWQARIRWTDSLGKRHSKSKNGFPTKAAASTWAIDEQANLSNGLKIDSSITFSAYYHDWYEKYKEPQLSFAAKYWYINVDDRIKKEFKNIRIRNITRSYYQNFINKYAKDHSPESVRKTNGIIRSCVRSAILDGYIIKDFTERISLGGNKDKKLEVEYLNIKEIKALLKEAKNINKSHLYTSRYMIITAIYTGMRLSEIQALTWNDIDWMHQTITINKSWDARHHKFKPTKNASSNRTIKVNQDLLQVLSDLRSRTNSNLVFTCWFGTVPTTDAVNNCLHKILSDLDIHRKNFHFHSLRHSHVALLLADGIDIYAISRRLGHSNIATTSNIYAYLIDEYKDKLDNQVLAALDDLTKENKA